MTPGIDGTPATNSARCSKSNDIASGPCWAWSAKTRRSVARNFSSYRRTTATKSSQSKTARPPQVRAMMSSTALCIGYGWPNVENAFIMGLPMQIDPLCAYRWKTATMRSRVVQMRLPEPSVLRPPSSSVWATAAGFADDSLASNNLSHKSFRMLFRRTNTGSSANTASIMCPLPGREDGPTTELRRDDPVLSAKPEVVFRIAEEGFSEGAAWLTWGKETQAFFSS
mmetsp:Transcript_32828/g.94173  ORF Transcript_32828/g.94173 Transcript_32828/m.94173 type:complete len:226 (+) Transcript_32828:1876-2553(+)